MAVGGRRHEIRATFRYLRALRLLIQRAAAEHAAWARFLGGTAAALGAGPGFTHREHADVASRYARAFASRRSQLAGLAPVPLDCATAHAAASAWLECLDQIASRSATAIARNAVTELDLILREAPEAGRRLRRLQRAYADTVSEVLGGWPPAKSAAPRHGARPAPRPARLA